MTKGVEDRVYAVSREADRIKSDLTSFAPELYKDAKLIVFDFEHMWSPLFQSGGIDDRAKAWAATEAEQLGIDNILFVTDRYGLNSEGNAVPSSDTVAGDQTAFFNGDVGANVAAYAQDVGTTVTDAASAVGDAAKKAAGATTDALKWAAILIVADLILYAVVLKR